MYSLSLSLIGAVSCFLLKLDSEYNSYGSEICKKVNNNDIELWNSKWLWSRKLKKILKDTKIISEEKITEIDIAITNDEVSLFNSSEYLFN